MAYTTKSVCFNNALAHLEKINSFAFKMFCKQELANNIDYERYIDAERYQEDNLQQMNDIMISKLEQFLATNDLELMKEVMGCANDSAVNREVREHFEQDACPLQLEQEFNTALDVINSSSDDLYDLYLNEY